jgi:predicted GNAT family acetyltransferase
MTENYVVEREDSPSEGRYVVRLAEGAEGEMTFRKTAPNVITIDHTGVPRAFRGAGIAQMLVDKAIADARAAGTKIVPLCSYVVAQFQRHPEWSDLLAK